MLVRDAVVSCQQIIEHASGSILVKIIIISLFVIIPSIRILLSIVKTRKKINYYINNCSQELPRKLQKIVRTNDLPQQLFFLSCSSSFVAVSTGFINKKIILSQKLIDSLDYSELEAIVLHEYHHVQSHHAIKILLLEVAAKTLFIFPILSDLSLYFKAKFETAADAAAVTKQKTTKHIKSSLQKVISFDTDVQIFPQFSHLIIDQRIDALNKYKSKKSLTLNYLNFFISTLSIIIVAGIFLFNSTYAVAQTMEEMETKITCSLIDCVQDCVAHEFMQRTPPMSENNFSVER